MKTPHLLPTVLFLAFASLVPRSGFGQGALTPPPGPPAPTMKTLDQLDAKLEPRTPISLLPFTISQPGSYYLTGNLAVTTGNAIIITTNGVTLDLNGFTISSTANPAAGTAIVPNLDLRDITIVNGHIRGTFQNGIKNSGALALLKKC